MRNNLILNIPHASVWIPAVPGIPDIHIMFTRAAFLQMLKKELLPMTDWYTDELFINGIGIPVVAPVSRIICDTERFRNDEDEPMAEIGMGVCYTRTHDMLRTIEWQKGHREWVLTRFYDVHHAALELAVGRALSETGGALILDCHSFSPVPLPYEPDRSPDRPDICIGTDAFHTPADLTETASDFFRSKGYSVKTDSPYAGTIVPMKHYGKDRRVRSVMIELNRGLYLKEGTCEKNDYFPVLKEHLREFQELLEIQYAAST